MQEKNYQPHEMRVIEEHHELELKLVKLKAFIDSDTSKGIDPTQAQLLRIQYHAMSMYADILHARIQLF